MALRAMVCAALPASTDPEMEPHPDSVPPLRFRTLIVAGISKRSFVPVEVKVLQENVPPLCQNVPPVSAPWYVCAGAAGDELAEITRMASAATM